MELQSLMKRYRFVYGLDKQGWICYCRIVDDIAHKTKMIWYGPDQSDRPNQNHKVEFYETLEDIYASLIEFDGQNEELMQEFIKRCV